MTKQRASLKSQIMLIGQRIDNVGSRCGNWNSGFDLVANRLGDLLGSWNAIDFGDQVAVLNGGRFVDDDRTVDAVLSGDLLARSADGCKWDGWSNWDGVWSVEVSGISLSLHKDSAADWGLRADSWDDILAFLLVSNLLVDNGHGLANALNKWGTGLSFKRLVLDPTCADEVCWGSKFAKQGRVDDRCWNDWGNNSWGYNCSRLFNSNLWSCTGSRKKAKSKNLKIFLSLLSKTRSSFYCPDSWWFLASTSKILLLPKKIYHILDIVIS